MDALFILYSGLIPVVPLVGAEIYKRRDDKKRRNVCYLLFAVQLLVSIKYIVTYLA